MAASNLEALLHTFLQDIETGQAPPEISHLGRVIPPDNYTLFFTDIDGVLIQSHPTIKNTKILAYGLIEEMKLLQRDPIVVTAAFSNMNLSDFVTKTNNGWELNVAEGKVRRADLFAYAKEHDFALETVITNFDSGYGRGPGIMFSELYSAVAKEYEAVKGPRVSSRRKKEFVETVGIFEEKLDERRKQVEAQIAGTPPYAKLFVEHNKPKSYFNDHDGHKHGTQKIGALWYFLQSAIKKPKKIIFIDDNPGCLQAVRAMIDIYNEEHPQDTIELDTIWFGNDGSFAVKNMAARQFADGALAQPAANVQDVVDLIKLKEELGGWLPILSKASVLERLIRLCNTGNPEALLLLAETLVNGSLGVVDPGAACKLAQFAGMFSEDKQFKLHVDNFIKKNAPSEPEGGKVKNDNIQELLNILKSISLYRGGSLWDKLKIWKQKKLEDSNAEPSRVIPYRDVYNKVAENWSNGAPLHAYHTIMHRYLVCTDPIEAKVIERCIEDYFTPLLVDNAIFNPAAYFYPEVLDHLAISEIEAKKLASGVNELVKVAFIAERNAEMVKMQQVFSDAIQVIPEQLQSVAGDVHQKKTTKKVKRGPFSPVYNTPAVLKLREELGKSILTTQVLIAFCRQGDAKALFLLAQAALKGKDVVEDRVSAYYLAMLAYVRATTPEGREAIRQFIAKNFEKDFIAKVENGEQCCNPEFPSINDCDPKKLFRNYKFHCVLEWEELKRLNQERLKQGVGNEQNQAVKTFDNAKKALKDEAPLLAYCFAMTAYLTCIDTNLAEAIEAFIRGAPIDGEYCAYSEELINVASFFLRKPDNYLLLPQKGMDKQPLADLAEAFKIFDEYVAQQKPAQASLSDDPKEGNKGKDEVERSSSIPSAGSEASSSSTLDDKDDKGKDEEVKREEIKVSASPNASMFRRSVSPPTIQPQNPGVGSSITPSTP